MPKTSKTVENRQTRQTGIIFKTHSYYMSHMEDNLTILGRPHFWPLNPIFAKTQGVGGGSPGIILKTHSYYMSQMEANLKILGRPHFWPLNPFLQKRAGGGGGHLGSFVRLTVTI